MAPLSVSIHHFEVPVRLLARSKGLAHQSRAAHEFCRHDLEVEAQPADDTLPEEEEEVTGDISPLIDEDLEADEDC